MCGFTDRLPEAPVPAELDATMIGQALTNLIKNAGEAIESLAGKRRARRPHAGDSRTADAGGRRWSSIADNGIGLPETARGCSSLT
jgi:two-component system nitrogen regulation sensor histidine kinase NtrY